MIRSLLPLLLAGAAFGSVAGDLKRFEGFRGEAYRDTQGFWTVGYGARCLEGARMTQATAEAWLDVDIILARAGARRAFPTFADHPQNVQDALTIMAFQLGAAGCTKFIRFNQALEARDYKRAASEMLASRWHKQTPHRVKELAQRIEKTK